MKKAFKFVESLKPTVLDLLGYPTIRFYSDYVEVYFDCLKVIRDFDVLSIGSYDEIRYFPGEGCITFVYTFYND